MVKINEPTANGATFPNSAGPGKCYAEFGMTHVASSENYQTCLFQGICVFRVYHILSELITMSYILFISCFAITYHI